MNAVKKNRSDNHAGFDQWPGQEFDQKMQEIDGKM